MDSSMGQGQTLKAVVLDWAGTVVDFGSLAPMEAFVSLFERHGIVVSVRQARVPMGLPKWDHIAALGRLPEVHAQWQRNFGRPLADSDVDRLYDEFTPMNAASVGRHADLIPGVTDMVAGLRAQGLKIGSTTGYNREIMAVLAPLARAQGYAPDNLVCAGDLAAGRPTPLMMYRCFADLGVWPAASVVKVDDTTPGIAEARAAGTWAVGVLDSGNEVGVSLSQWSGLSNEDRAERRGRAEATLREAGAHEVISTVAELLPALDRIRSRANRGESPAG